MFMIGTLDGTFKTIISEQYMTENVMNLSKSELPREGNAYEFLMKDALERKRFVFEVICLMPTRSEYQ